jgi:death-on-curing protein
MESFLALNGYEINASTDEQVEVVLSLASGNLSRDESTAWISNHTQKLP